MPDMLNWFGWCTWDAFYTDVTAEGVKQGLERYFTHLGSLILHRCLQSCLIMHTETDEDKGWECFFKCLGI